MEEQEKKEEVKSKDDVKSIVGFVLSIVGLVTFFFVPCLGAIPGFVMALIGMILSALALRENRTGKAGGRGLAIAGLTCGAVPVVWFLLTMSSCAACGLGLSR